MVNFDRLIPLGSWCRNAFQINRFRQEHGQKSISYPFDWTITPLHSLEKIFSPSFDDNQISISMRETNFLKKEQLIDETGLIFFHDTSQGATPKIAKERFLHTFKHIKKETNLIFIRWLDQSHHEIRQSVWNEDRNPTYEKLIENLKIFLNNDTFKLIEIETKYEDPGDCIQNKNIVNNNLVRYAIAEPLRVEPRKSQNFRGSDKAWNLVLNDIMENYGKL